MLKKLLGNKIIKFALLALGCFVLVNAGMFFFLRATSPKMGERVETAHADSTAHHEGLPHDLANKGEGQGESKNDSTKQDGNAVGGEGSKAETPVAASLVAPETPAMPPPVEPEQKVSSVDSTPVAAATEPQPTEANDAKAEAPATTSDGKEMAKLAKLLESVKPDEAASIASQLDVDQIVSLMMRMKDRNAGRMLAAMAPQQAARVAARMSELAGQPRKKS